MAAKQKLLNSKNLFTWQKKRLVIVSDYPLLSGDDCLNIGGVQQVRSDIPSIQTHLNDIQQADIIIFLDGYNLFELPRTDAEIRKLLQTLRLVTSVDVEAISKKFPQPFEEEPLLNPDRYAVELLAYDYTKQTIGRTSTGKLEWLGSKNTEDPVLQRQRLTEAVAQVVSQCFVGGQGHTEQHILVLWRDGCDRFRSEVMDIVFGKERQAAKNRNKSDIPGMLKNICHALGCLPADNILSKLPGMDGLLMKALGKSAKPIPLQTGTGKPCGFFIKVHNLHLHWIAENATPHSERDALSACLNEFGILWPLPKNPITSAATGSRLELTGTPTPLRFKRQGWIVHYKNGTRSVDISMGHRAFLLLLAHVVSATLGEPGINPTKPRIAGKSIGNCYKARSQKATAKPAAEIHRFFKAAGIQHPIIQPVGHSGHSTSQTLYCLSMPSSHVNHAGLQECGDADIAFLLSLLPPRN